MTDDTAAILVVEPHSDILCVHRSRPFLKPRVFVGVLLLRCVSRLSGRPCLFKDLVKATETAPGEFSCDSASVMRRLPGILEYRGNWDELVVVEEGTKLVFVTGRCRTAAKPETRPVCNAWMLTDCRTAPAILDTGCL
jgi:hypothetical protein